MLRSRLVTDHGPGTHAGDPRGARAGNVIGVLSGTPERVREWSEAGPGRFIPGFQFQFGRETTTPGELRDLYRAGRFAVLAEVTNQVPRLRNASGAILAHVRLQEGRAAGGAGRLPFPLL
jgi:hypothetical protein